MITDRLRGNTPWAKVEPCGEADEADVEGSGLGLKPWIAIKQLWNSRPYESPSFQALIHSMGSLALHVFPVFSCHAFFPFSTVSRIF